MPISRIMTPPKGSQSNPPAETNQPPTKAPAGESPAGVTAPPLRVTAQPNSSILSEMRQSLIDIDGDGLTAADPVDENRSSIPSSDKLAAPEVTPPASLKEAARGLILGLSALIAGAVFKDDAGAVDVVIATEEEQAGIGDPIAAIGARHMKMSAGGNPDIGNLITAGAAALFYGIRAVTGIFNLRRTRRATAAATGDPTEHATSEGTQHE